MGAGETGPNVDRQRKNGAAARARLRQTMKREWQLTRRAEAFEKSYRNLLQRYTVTIEPSRLARSAGEPGSKRQP